MISNSLTNIPGSSDYFIGAVVAYSNSVKVSLLKVPSNIIKKRGAVSSEAALAMAKGVRSLLKADASLAITGIAGPAGGTREKPVGSAYIAFDSGRAQKVKKVNFKGSRLNLKKKFSLAALKMIEENI